MTIEWAENPLLTTVTLNDDDRNLMKYNIAVDAIHSAVVMIHMDEDKHQKKHGGRWVDSFDYNGLDEKQIQQRIEELVKCYEADLTGSHHGDCTCAPVSCSKCLAEAMLGVDTLIAIGKHEAYAISYAFRDAASLAEALSSLRAPFVRPEHVFEGWEAHVPRWTAERNRAAALLEQYGKDHGFAIN